MISFLNFIVLGQNKKRPNGIGVILLILLLFSNSKIIAQNKFPSPNVASLGEYALYPVSPFTGQANIDIPLTTVSYGDINVPVSLLYNTKGNTVKDHPSFVGLGWTLLAGGVITRKSFGPEDEVFAPGSNTDYSYISNAQQVASRYADFNSIKTYALENGLNEPSFQLIDAMPDEFVFNFNGYSGTFYITSSGIKIKPNGNYNLKAEILEIKDNLSTSSFTYYGRIPRCIYKIKICDDKGYSYIFGGSLESLELVNSMGLKEEGNVVNSWLLTEIISPDGNKIVFEYEKNGVIIIPSSEFTSLITSGSTKFSSYAHVILAFSLSWGSSSYSTYYRGIGSTYAFISPSYLKSIKTAIDTVSFSYLESNELEYNFDKYSSPTLQDVVNYGAPGYYHELQQKKKWMILDQISHSNNKNKIDFKYRNIANARLRLDSVIYGNSSLGSSRLNSYSFFYNPLVLPNYESRMVDHWGYFNGIEYQYNDNFYFDRSPKANFLKAEMLERVVNPLGGEQIIEYEPHYYSIYATQFPFSVKDTSNSVMAGGLRVKSIHTKAEINSISLKKDYYYNFDFLNGGQRSSGVLNGIPRYSNAGERFSAYKSGGFWSGGSFSSTSYYEKTFDHPIFRLSTSSGSHISYSEVVIKDELGYVVNFFSNHNNGYTDKAPDLMYGNFSSKMFEERFISKDLYRGLLLKQSIYSKSKVIQKEILNEYDIDTLLTSNTMAARNAVPFIQRAGESLISATRVTSGRFFTQPALLKKIITNNYENGILSNSFFTEYKRDLIPSNGNDTYPYYPKETIQIDSKGKLKKTLFKYPFDLISSNSVYSKMVNNNMLNYPIEATHLKDDKVVSSELIEYKEFHTGVISPSKKYRLGLDAPMNDFVFTSIKADTLSKDNNYLLEEHFLDYSFNGKLLEENKPNGIKVSYIWGYNNQFPIAQIKNANYAVVESVLGGETAVNDFSNSSLKNDEQINTFLAPLRSSPLLKDAMITTYTYKPLIGMTSQTDSKGATTYYEYDSFQRLSSIRGQDRNLVKTYDYNYAGQEKIGNEVRERSFERNNCIEGYAPGYAIQYRVPENKYFSKNSLQEANSQAVNDLNLNGQLYANSTCPCYKIIYVKLEYEPVNYIVIHDDGDQSTIEYRGNIIMSFYKDALKQIPIDVSDQQLSSSIEIDARSDIFPEIDNPYNFNCEGSRIVILTDVPLKEEFAERDFDSNQFKVIRIMDYNYSLLPNPRYILVN